MAAWQQRGTDLSKGVCSCLDVICTKPPQRLTSDTCSGPTPPLTCSGMMLTPGATPGDAPATRRLCPAMVPAPCVPHPATSLVSGPGMQREQEASAQVPPKLHPSTSSTYPAGGGTTARSRPPAEHVCRTCVYCLMFDCKCGSASPHPISRFTTVPPVWTLPCFWTTQALEGGQHVPIGY